MFVCHRRTNTCVVPSHSQNVVHVLGIVVLVKQSIERKRSGYCLGLANQRLLVGLLSIIFVSYCIVDKEKNVSIGHQANIPQCCDFLQVRQLRHLQDLHWLGGTRSRSQWKREFECSCKQSLVLHPGSSFPCSLLQKHVVTVLSIAEIARGLWLSSRS